MDFKKIFIKDACPTKIGGQAIMEGVMMRGPDRVALAMRLPDGGFYLKTEKKAMEGKIMKVPLIRGVVAFVKSLVVGMGTLMKSADILEAYLPEDESAEPGRFEKKMTEKFGEKAIWNFLMLFAVAVSIILSVGIFVIFPTIAVNWLGKYISSSIALNLIEGVFRIILFILYVLLISRMQDIKRLFQYHGSEHKTIHCYENGLELTPENAQQFYTLHPRCGTSFLMFVFIISLLLFSLLGWPNVWLRIASRVLLIPVIAGISYELLRWAGRSDNFAVRILSYPGLLMQKLTTAEPDESQLEVAILSLKAVLVPPETPEIDGPVDKNGIPVPETDGSNPWPEISARAPRYGDAPVSVENTLKWGRDCLAMIENGKRDADDIFCYVMGFTHSELVTRAGELLDEKDVVEYEYRVNKRLTGTPIQYILHYTEFMGLPFRVDERVLIPRQDTEILAAKALRLIDEKAILDTSWEAPAILDMCTGSGALGVSIAHARARASVTMTDISEDALTVARENAAINGVSERCAFLAGDLFEPLSEASVYHMIVSNPPYIRTADIATLAVEIREHEPFRALDGGADGLDYYKRIADAAPAHLLPGGILALETGYDQAEDVKAILWATGEFTDIRSYKDLAGLDRVVTAEKRKAAPEEL